MERVRTSQIYPRNTLFTLKRQQFSGHLLNTTHEIKPTFFFQTQCYYVELTYFVTAKNLSNIIMSDQCEAPEPVPQMNTCDATISLCSHEPLHEHRDNHAATALENIFTWGFL